MATRRNILSLQKDEEKSLRVLYREFNIPTDQYPQRPDDLQRLVSAWNTLTGRNELEPDVLHYMITKRKNGDWERLGRGAGGDYHRPHIDFSKEEKELLDAIHEDLQIASDSFVLNAEAAKRLQDEFARRTGRIVPPMILAATMIYRRKNGNLATLKPKSDDQDLGFTDIDKVVR